MVARLGSTLSTTILSVLDGRRSAWIRLRDRRVTYTAAPPCGSASSASVWLHGRRPSSVAQPRSRDPRDRPLAPPRLGEIAAPRLVTLATRVVALGDLPASPSAPPLRCPGAVTPRAVSLAARSQLLGSLPRLWRRLLGQSTGSPAMPRSEDRWRPACRSLATARSRRVTFHLYKGTEQRRTVAAGSGGKLGSLSGETKRDRLQASPFPSNRSSNCARSPSLGARFEASGRKIDHFVGQSVATRGGSCEGEGDLTAPRVADPGISSDRPTPRASRSSGCRTPEPSAFITVRRAVLRLGP